MLDKTAVLNSCDSIFTISAPLRKFLKINYFGYLKLYADGTHICLSTRADWQQCFYTNFFQHGVYHKNMDIYKEGFHLWSQIVDQTTPTIMRNDFNIDHGLTLVEKSEDYCEIFAFATDPKYQDITSWYLNNLDILKSFCLFFKEQGKTLIKSAEADRLILPKCLVAEPRDVIVDNLAHKSGVRKFFLDNIALERYYLGGQFKNIYLTQQELNCIKQVSQGNTIKEAAILLGISPRTVETHLNNVKSKLGTRNLVETVAVIVKYLSLYL